MHIYSPAKSIANTFKYRNKLGPDVALEALKLYRRHPAFDVDGLLHHARILEFTGESYRFRQRMHHEVQSDDEY